MADKDDTFFRELVAHHVSGQLKVAPEHVSDRVLNLMGKPKNAVYKAFSKSFILLRARLKEQYLVPYLMSSHPGSGLKEAVELAEYLRDNNLTPEQVQDFILLRPPYRRVCIIRESIRVTAKAFTYRVPRTKRQCSARLYSIKIPRITIWCARLSLRREGRTL